MANTPYQEDQRRHRDAQHGGSQQGTSLISYVPRPNAERIRLIKGDADTFMDILSLLGEYEAILDRHESLAANLGAKLTGPRLIKGIEKIFDGPLKTRPSQPLSAPISWIDVVSFAKNSPGEFVLTPRPDGSRCCRFAYKGVHIEITEDDWRLISSGALDHFPLQQPFEEDEVAEMATLDLVEQRASILYKKADEVAARARIIHHRIGQRKNDLVRRRGQDGAMARSHHTPYTASHSGHWPTYDLHADLLQQFSTRPSSPENSRSTASTGLSAAGIGRPPLSSSSPHPNFQPLSTFFACSPGRMTLDARPATATESRGEKLRYLISMSTDSLAKGDIITPPCDRCRRLRLPCIRHLTACQGCTKKHAKCSWRSVTDEEAARVRDRLGREAETKRANGGNVLALEEGRFAPSALGSRTSLLRSDSASRRGSQADIDMSNPVDSPRPLPVPRNKLLPLPNSRSLSLPTGFGGISIMQDQRDP